MNTPTAYFFDRIFDGACLHDNAALLVEDGKSRGIVGVDDVPARFATVEPDGCICAPGFVDLQVNGGGGLQFNSHPHASAIAEICGAHLRLGTTSTLVTLITDSDEKRTAALAAAARAAATSLPGFLGLHLEGPFLSQAKKGAHDPRYIRPMNGRDLAQIRESAREIPVLLLTVAPESVSSDQVRQLADAGMVVSLGHTNCSFAQARERFAAGARMVTHLFNAMSPLGHREPGLVGAALTHGETSAGLIADGVHVDPAVIRLALRAKTGSGQIFLVSDAMAPAGTDMPSFELNGRTIRRASGRLELADGTLAGADTTMAASVRYLHHHVDVPLAKALAMATSIPARAVAMDGRKGTLAAGADADFVALDDGLQVAGIWYAGDRIATK